MRGCGDGKLGKYHYDKLMSASCSTACRCEKTCIMNSLTRLGELELLNFGESSTTLISWFLRGPLRTDGQYAASA